MTKPNSLPEALTGSATTGGGVQLEYRLLDASLLDTVCQLEREAHSHPWSRNLFADCLGARQPCVVAFNHSQLVGYAVIKVAAGNAELLNIAVAANCRRQGIAHALLQHIISAVSPHADTLYLEVRQSNQTALELYDTLGFVEVGIRPNYYPAKKGREDAVILAYPL